ncbi:MAG: LysR family transcriptional regulator [Proteobacteria bacterium]|nr:LysR family transcriptional regulator [Pseudomonadota bacterium]
MEWLNYHHLLYFWMVAREGGLEPAGKVLRLSQSALSGQIKRLEDMLGHPLFERRGRKLAMTETGRVVYKYAEQIFGLGREMLDTIRERPTSRALRLTVGISDVVPKLLVRTLLEPALRHEGLALTCKEDRFDRLLAELALDEVDVVIADAPVPPDASVRAYNHLLGESTVTLLAPAALAPAMRRSFPRGLDGARLLLPTPGCTLRRNLDAWFADAEVQPLVVAQAEDSALLKAFAADGMGALFVPTVIAKVIAQRYELVEVAEVVSVRERFYAISAERRLVHPAVVAIRTAARNDLFA